MDGDGSGCKRRIRRAAVVLRAMRIDAISSRRWTRYFAMLLRDRSRMYTAVQRDRL
jgi:hypothetical protein